MLSLLPFKLPYTRHYPRHWDSRKNQRMPALLKLTIWWDSEEMGLKIFEKHQFRNITTLLQIPPYITAFVLAGTLINSVF